MFLAAVQKQFVQRIDLRPWVTFCTVCLNVWPNANILTCSTRSKWNREFFANNFIPWLAPMIDCTHPSWPDGTHFRFTKSLLFDGFLRQWRSLVAKHHTEGPINNLHICSTCERHYPVVVVVVRNKRKLSSKCAPESLMAMLLVWQPVLDTEFVKIHLDSQ